MVSHAVIAPKPNLVKIDRTNRWLRSGDAECGIDVPNLLCGVACAQKRRGTAPDLTAINFDRLVEIARKHFCVRRCCAYVPDRYRTRGFAHRLRSASALPVFVSAHAWRSLPNKDAVDRAIITRILAIASQIETSPIKTYVLVSEDGGYAGPLRRLINAGGTAVLLHIGRPSKKLRELTQHPNVIERDLRSYNPSIIDFRNRTWLDIGRLR